MIAHNFPYINVYVYSKMSGTVVRTYVFFLRNTWSVPHNSQNKSEDAIIAKLKEKS